MSQPGSMFHSGERQVQRLMHVEDMAARVGRGIRPSIHPAMAEFLLAMSYGVVGTVQDGVLRVFMLNGEPGFVTVPNPDTCVLSSYRSVPAGWQPRVGADFGMLAIDLSTRRRIRLNGVVDSVSANRVTLRSRQCYANCPKYIQRRALSPGVSDNCDTVSIEDLDTFFIATSSPEGGIDVSHRGGNPGFLHQTGPSELQWTEYDGNTMYNTLGNLVHSSHAALLLMDFNRQVALHVAGHASVDYSEQQPRVTFQIAETLSAPLPWRTSAVDPSPHNPVD